MRGGEVVLQVISCIVYEHDYRGIALAALVCIVGSLMAMRLFTRTRRVTGTRRAVWTFLSGVICGCTIWTTHFVAMLGYQPPIQHAYDPVVTLISLVMAIGFSTIGMSIAANARSSWLIEAGGATIGIGIAAMHFTGMYGFLVAGHFDWDMGLVAASIGLGAAFGALAMNRIARPVTRFCKYGGALALILAIVSMHFTAMGAISIVPDPSVVVPPKMIENELLMIGVLAVMAILLGTGLSTDLIDTHSQEEAVQRYRHLALHDAITGLPNRAFLSTRLGDALRSAGDDNSRVAVIGIDLDRFKDVNDVHGHAAGDLVLKTLAERLSARLGRNEFLARVGGDEFVAVKLDVFSINQAREFAKSLREEICRPIEQGDRVLSVGASLGVTLFPDDGGTVDELLGRADLAMYRAKQSPAAKICRYDASMDENSRNRSALAMELRYAIERDELELHYQPQTEVGTGEVIGYEALLRWHHPVRGLVGPNEFIPIAEETGLIVPIGEWVLKTACAEAASWRRQVKIAVNIAPAQIAQSNLPTLVHQTLLRTGLNASRLELEITESSIIADHQHALHVIRQLKALGVTIAMDDYGTGYSSLSTLQTFPFDKIKIDRSFVNAVTENDQADAIVKSTIILANSLRIPVLAEGVESEGHLEFLRREGCHEAQGYLFGRPAPVEQVRAVVGRIAAPVATLLLPKPQEEPLRAVAPEPEQPLRKSA